MRICLIGEGMIELSRQGDGWRLGHGGDTLNTAVHLARYGWDVGYITALGVDPFSDDLRRAWAAEGLDTRLILTDPGRQPGLYCIRTDEAGERSFFYWRGDSAARGLFALPGIDAVLAAAERTDLLCYSLVTLAILSAPARDQLFALCRRIQVHGGKIAFDGNYRARIWESVGAARAARDVAASCCDIGLPTLEDETKLSGTTSAAEVAAHWAGQGTREVVVKLGALGCMIGDGTIVPPPCIVTPVDTSGAGDAFNAGYLHARLSGVSIKEAARAGHRLAGWVVSRSGAIPPRDEAADYGSPRATPGRTGSRAGATKRQGS